MFKGFKKQRGFLGTAAAVIGIASGAKNLLSSGKSSSSPSVSSVTQQATSPWWLSSGGNVATNQLQSLIQGGPASVAGNSAFRALNDRSVQATQRALAAHGLTGSGNEMIALNDLNNSNMESFYKDQVGLLGSLAGVGYNPANGVAAGQTQQGINNNQNQQSWGAIGQGIGGLASIYGSHGLFSSGTQAPVYDATPTPVGGYSDEMWV